MSRQPSRRERYEKAMGLVSTAKDEVESLKDELDEWLGNMPENLQGGSKADELGEAIAELETTLEGLEQAEDASPEFPGMR